MNFDNGHRQRQNQHQHNKRGRGRNNRRPGQHGGGGNPANRVYESNGPDVKVRGTAQTIAEKYMQLGRDAHASGDNVMAESYYQFAEHYFRVLQASQPLVPVATLLRRHGEEPEEEIETVEGDEGASPVEGVGEAQDAASQTADEGAESQVDEPQGGEFASQREHRSREPREGREGYEGGGGRERFRPRWQRRHERGERSFDRKDDQIRSETGNPAEAQFQTERQAPSRADEVVETAGDWEAPSFLKRPVAIPAASSEPSTGDTEEVVEKQRPRTRRPRSVNVAPVEGGETSD